MSDPWSLEECIDLAFGTDRDNAVLRVRELATLRAKAAKADEYDEATLEFPTEPGCYWAREEYTEEWEIVEVRWKTLSDGERVLVYKREMGPIGGAGVWWSRKLTPPQFTPPARGEGTT